MGMSTHIVGFRPADEKYERMKAIWDACEDAGVQIPEEVLQFFEYESPDECGVKIDLEEDECILPYSGNSESGFELYINDLPKDVTIVRFYNSW